MMNFRDAQFTLVAEELGMDVVALIERRFVYFHLDAMRVGPSVLADAGYLPGNFHSRLAGLDGEAAVVHFCRDDGLCKLADHGNRCSKPRTTRAS
jgi:hypothetical protein